MDRDAAGAVMQKNRERISGFTLPEIMIVILIFLFIMIALMTLLTSAKSSWFIAEVQSDLYQNARLGMQKMVRELNEASSGYTETFKFLDPITGEISEGLWFASGRGDPSVSGENGSATNDYVHLDSDNIISWRSVVVYCPYKSTDEPKQLRRYVSYGSSAAYFSGSNIFPLTFISATTNTLTFAMADSTYLTFSRSGGEVLTNYISTEDTNNNGILDANENDGNASLPLDNADGVLNYGANFSKNVGDVEISLFLTRQVSRFSQSGLTLSSTLRNTIKLRQP